MSDLLDALNRQAGLTGRYLASGALALPATLANPLAWAANQGLGAIGSDYRFPDQYEALQRAMTEAGLPQPQSGPEKVAGFFAEMGVPDPSDVPKVAAGVSHMIDPNQFGDLLQAMMLFHGSPKTGLDVIKSSAVDRQYDNATSRLGAFFSPDEAGAARYAGDSGEIYRADVDLKNPYEMPYSEFKYYQDPTKSKDGNPLDSLRDSYEARSEELIAEAEAFRKELEAAGHDGVIVRNSKGEPIEIASFADVLPIKRKP